MTKREGDAVTPAGLKKPADCIHPDPASFGLSKSDNLQNCQAV